MATINYNGMELEEVTTPQVFDPPRKCIVWNSKDGSDWNIREVYAILSNSYSTFKVICAWAECSCKHCALLPDPPKPRRATNRELSRWLAEGKGEILVPHCVTQHVSYAVGQDNEKCGSGLRVRKWSDTEWHEPTVDYLGLDDDHYNFNKKYKGE